MDDEIAKVGRPKDNSYTLKRINQIKAFLDEGLSQKEISEEIELTPSTVSLYCKRHGLQGPTETRICRKCGKSFDVMKSKNTKDCKDCRKSNYIKVKDRTKEYLDKLYEDQEIEKETKRHIEDVKKIVVGNCSNPLTYLYYSMFAKW